jgi:glycosyltransferase involved in cell wall biosynthesis
LNSLWLSHPTGNVFVRALLRGLCQERWDYHFFSTVAFAKGERWLDLVPRSAREELSRRCYELPADRIISQPMREGMRLLTMRLTNSNPRENSAFSAQAVYESLDRLVAKSLERTAKAPAFVYAYEDGALATFEAARTLGINTIYELPILYWEIGKKILETEAARLPEWEPTLGATRDSGEKLERKRRELELADTVVCPSRSVFESLPAQIRSGKQCIISAFGSPATVTRPARCSPKMRVLFVGQMSQRKGLADVFAAMKHLRRPDVELIVLGAALMPMDFYRSCYSDFLHEGPRNHAAALELMASCDVLVLPSLVEGRALVQQEALACGLPLVVTENAGAPELIETGKTGFLVPIRSPEAIAEKIDWFASHRSELEEMRCKCREKAAAYTWEDYAAGILDTVVNAPVPRLPKV